MTLRAPLAHDPLVPQRDALLDTPRLGVRLDQLLGMRGPAGITGIERLRVKYRVGRGVGLVLRVHVARRGFLVSARSFAAGRGRFNYERALATFPEAIAGLRPVSFAPELETVFWTFPHDRRIESLELLCGPNEDLTGLLGARCVPVLAAYVPEKAATARCVDERGASVAYVKVYAATENDDGARSLAILSALHTALAEEHGTVRVPRPLGYDPARRALAVEAVPGEPLVGGGLSGAGPRLAGLGAALATLHAVSPPPELAPFERLAPDRLARAAELIGSVRPDVALAVDALSRALCVTFEVDSDHVCLHGDAHGKNALGEGGRVALVDLDQAGIGPAAADLGSVLAGLRYRQCLRLLSGADERALADDLLGGYRSVRELPGERVLAWHTAASLLAERALRAVTRVRPEGLSRLAEVIDAGHRARASSSRRASLARGRARARGRPPLLLYCQHAVGLGHLTRSLALAAGLAERFDVVLLSGGTVPRHVIPPRGVELVRLPPLILEQGGGLRSPDRRRTVERAKELRARMLSDVVRAKRPAVVVVELFPFGRRAFAGEIVTMLEVARAVPGVPPLVASSVRDILVGRGEEQAAYDERVCHLANTWFDAILVHADPRFAKLEESFQPRTPLRVPVHYTGFVSAAPETASAPERRARRIVVSAGGGRVGEPLLQAAIEAHPHLWGERGMSMRLIAGPFLADDAWRRLRGRAKNLAGLELRRDVSDLSDELGVAGVSVSQCGYNTSLEVLRAQVPALVVPYLAPGEDEQLRRARRLHALGAIRMLDPRELSGPRLAEQVGELDGFAVPRVELDLGGAGRSTELLWQQLRKRSAGRAPAAIA